MNLCKKCTAAITCALRAYPVAREAEDAYTRAYIMAEDAKDAHARGEHIEAVQ